MSTDVTWQIKSDSPEMTEQLGRAIGSRLRGGEVIELISDLGGGKTTLVRGLAAGASSTDNVSSPSFTISQVYEAPKVTLHHYDFYRLAEPGLMSQEISEVINDPQAVVIAEWADVIEDALPAEHVSISITATSENARQFVITLPAAYDYLQGAT